MMQHYHLLTKMSKQQTNKQKIIAKPQSRQKPLLGLARRKYDNKQGCMNNTNFGLLPTGLTTVS